MPFSLASPLSSLAEGNERKSLNERPRVSNTQAKSLGMTETLTVTHKNGEGGREALPALQCWHLAAHARLDFGVVCEYW